MTFSCIYVLNKCIQAFKTSSECNTDVYNTQESRVSFVSEVPKMFEQPMEVN